MASPQCRYLQMSEPPVPAVLQSPIVRLCGRNADLCPHGGSSGCFACQIGETVFAEGQAGFKPLSATQMKKGKVFENIAPDLKTDADGVATWKGLKLLTSAGPCTAPLPNAAIN